jgi:radical SAM superfamily enzyme YgiQ (UPF0313 family)
MNRTVVVYNPNRFKNEFWLPTLWSQAKTYYEKNGQRVDDWQWAPCLVDIWGDDFERVKLILGHVEPDVFAVSLYVWNYHIGHKVAKWVKERWPNCLVITGGPHQYFKHDDQWFEKHPYIDASLPGECYGELCLQEILDNIDPDGNVDFDLVTDICYPKGLSRYPVYSQQRSTMQTKKSFDYNWPSYSTQHKLIEDFVSYTQTQFPEANFLAIVETTRGCPYGCTYCDWGGGISTTVIKKDVEVVKQDLALLCSLDLQYLYIADANFGIFGDRDIEIMQSLIRLRKQHDTDVKLGYGGFAKTENKLSYIKELVTLDLDNQLSNKAEIKISLQTLDQQVLKNIDRKNISLDKQLEIFRPLSKKKRLPLYIEIIMGLPGMSLEKFYHELDVLGKNNLSVMWFEWLLLPETPAYDPAYRKQFGIQTVDKNQGWAWKEAGADRKIVIETDSYSSDDYLEMLLATGLYNAVIQGGLFRESVDWISAHKNYNLGNIIKNIIAVLGIPNNVKSQWAQILKDPNQPCMIDTHGITVYLAYYYVAQYFFDPENFIDAVKTMLVNQYQCPESVVDTDIQLMIHQNNFGQRRRHGLWTVKYRGDSPTTESAWNTVLGEFLGYKNSNKILRATKKFLIYE